MRNQWLRQKLEIITRSKLYQRWKRVFALMAAVVIFWTNYFLLLPVITQASAPICGKEEHTHTGYCYEQFSIEKTSVLHCQEEHMHDVACYVEVPAHMEGNIVCGEQEHVHDKTCYREYWDMEAASKKAEQQAKRKSGVMLLAEPDYAFEIIPPCSVDVDIPAGVTVKLRVVGNGHKVRVNTVGSKDTYGYLYDANGKQITYNDDGGSGTNFQYDYTMVRGTVYFIGVRFYNSSATGTVTLETSLLDNHVFVNGSCGCGLTLDDAHGTIDNGTAEGLTWSIDKAGVFRLEGEGSMPDFPSTGAVPWFVYATAVTRAEVDPRITNVSDYAFYGMNAMTSASLPDGITSIGTSAFEGCTKLTTVGLPSSVRSVGSRAFYNCSQLADTLPPELDELGSDAFRSCTKLLSTGTLKLNMDTIPNYAFYGCAAMKGELILPENAKKIGDYALYNCNQLEKINIPDSITDIGSYAFYNCTKMDGLHVPASLKNLGTYAFYYAKMKEAILPETLTSIPTGAFYYCSGLEHVEYPNTLKTIGTYAFAGCSMLAEKLELPSSVTTVGDYAYSYCTSMTEVELPETVTSWGIGVFKNCSGLTEVALPNNMKEIPNYFFYYCSNLEEVSFAPDITRIGNYTFYYCSKLDIPQLPETVNYIGSYAFGYCDQLTEFTIPSKVTYIYGSTFTHCSRLERVNGLEQIVSVGDNAFSYCPMLKELEFSDKLATISSNAFAYSGLERFELGANHTSLSTYLFQGCTNLQELVIHSGLKSLPNYLLSSATLQTLVIEDIPATLNSSSFANATIRNVEWRVPAVTGTADSLQTIAPEQILVGKEVDVLPAFLMSSTHLKPNTTLLFEGENWFRLEQLPTNLTEHDSYKELTVGDYYVSADGVLYRIENGRATVVMCPPGLTEATIPASVPDQNGNPCPVTTVGRKAFFNAKDLTTLTFEKVDAIRKVDTAGFANAKNLTSINGMTEDYLIEASFAPNVYVSPGAFYNTGIQQTIGSELKEDLIVHRTDGRGPQMTVSFQSYDDYYTGEFANMTIQLSNPDNSGTSDQGDYNTRLYIAFDNRDGQLSYKTGEFQFVSSMGQSYRVNISETAHPGIYCLEFDRPHSGDTLTVTLNILYPNGTSGGGDARIWGTVLTEQESELLGDELTKVGDYHRLHWKTQVDDFTVAKRNTYSSLSLKGDGKENGRISVGNLAFTITTSRLTTLTREGTGKDFMYEARFTDVAHIPDGLQWAPEILAELRAGRVQYTTGSRMSDNNYYYNCFYVTVNGQTKPVLYFSSNSSSNYTFNRGTLTLNEQNDPVLTWSITNSKRYTTEMPSLSTTVYFGPQAVIVNPEWVDDFPADGVTIDNTVTMDQSFNFSEDQQDVASVTCPVKIPGASFSVSKYTNIYGYYSGDPNSYYITLSNDGARPYRGIYQVNDKLSNYLYIKPENIAAMFNHAENGKRLILTIGNATFTRYEDPPLTVTGTDGKKYITSNANTGVQATTNHDGMEDTYRDDANVTDGQKTYYDTMTGGTAKGMTMRLRWEGDELVLTYGKAGNSFGSFYDATATTRVVIPTNSDGTVTGDTIKGVFEEIGYLVTYQSVYEVVWDLSEGSRIAENGTATQISDFTLWGGQSVRFDIPSHLKDTFQIIDRDYRNYYTSTNYYLPTNYAYAYYDYQNANGDWKYTYKSSYASGRNISRDWTLDKEGSINGAPLDANTSVVDGSVVDYFLTATHNTGRTNEYTDASPEYDILPWVDRMRGAQVLMVPVEGNRTLEDRYPQLAARRILYEETAYYLLSEPGTYEGVVIGGMLTDHVTVTDLNGDGLDTMIYWYLPTLYNSFTKNLAYKAMVNTSYSGYSNSVYTIDNQTWLNDHETHRLWDTVGEIGGSNLSFDKSIVLNPKGTGEELNPHQDVLSDYSRFFEGDQVTYRFTLERVALDFVKEDDGAEGGSSYLVLTNEDIYDVLPQIPDIDGVRWEDADFTMRWCADGENLATINNLDHFSITPNHKTPPDPNLREIRWADDFSIVFYKPTTIYIYVTMQLPEHTQWYDYCKQYGSTTLINTLYVNGKPDSVYHDMVVGTQANLEKGVYFTGMQERLEPVNSEGSYVARKYLTGEESRHIYQNDSSGKGTVLYYTTLYNSGIGRLYLTELQDCLPKGFRFVGVTCKSTSGTSSSSHEYNALYRNRTNRMVGDVDLATVFDSNGVAVPFSSKARTVYVTTTTSVNANGQEVVRFVPVKRTDLTAYNQGLTTMRWDDRAEAYYLNPGEYLVMGYEVYTNAVEDTEDVATNVVAMRYWDYTQGGLTPDYNPYTTGKFPTTAYSTPATNDGLFEMISEEEAEYYGFTGGREGDEWLSSKVTLHRGPITPGIIKKAVSITKNSGVVDTNFHYAEPQDTVNWQLDVYNDGDCPMVDYTITDVMQSPYRFTGAVTYQRYAPYGTTMAATKVQKIMDIKSYNLDAKGNILSVNVQYQSTSSNGTTVSKSAVIPYGTTLEVDDLNCSTYNSDSSSYQKSTKAAFRFYKNEAGYECLAIRFKDNMWALAAKGHAVLSLSTYTATTAYVNTMYYNSCFITPEQEFESDLVGRGNNTEMIDTDRISLPSVRNSAPITVSYGFATTSFKEVYEDGKYTVNKAASTDTVNYIALPESDTPFRYRLHVFNPNAVGMSELIIIDNLPEKGDYVTFNQHEPRYSEFNVRLADDPDFQVWIEYRDGSKKVLTRGTTADQDHFVLQFHDKVVFESNDWRGNGTGWYNEPKSTTRSFRIVLSDSTKTLIRESAKAVVDFAGAIIDVEHTNPGMIAWNSFGYHYVMSGMHLEAAPLNVGIKTPSGAEMKKKLENNYGGASLADKDEVFRYLVYRNDDGKTNLAKCTTEAEMAALLVGKDYLYTELTVEAGKSESSLVNLRYASRYTWQDGAWTSTGVPFDWVQNAKYTVYELPRSDDSFHFYTMNGREQNGLTFTYDRSQTYRVTTINRRENWKISLGKISETGGKLEGAVFALYSPSATEAMPADQVAQWEQTLDLKLHSVLTWDDGDYYLARIERSDEEGRLDFNDLREKHRYFFQELVPPVPYELDDTLYEVPYDDSIRKNGYVYQKLVVNRMGYVLPRTGGMGSEPLTVSGLLVMATSAVLWSRKRRDARG